MSRENVDAVHRGYALWNEDEVEAMLSQISPGFEYVSTGLVPGLQPVYRGHEGWRDFWRDYRGSWESLRIELNDTQAVEDHVVALVTQHGRSRQGIEVRRQFANIWTFDDDSLVVRIRAYGAWSDALEASAEMKS